MKQHQLIAMACSLLASATSLQAQTTLPLASIIPGTEKVQLVYNGDFQFEGPTVTNTHPSPVGWQRLDDMFVGSGTNMVQANDGTVAQALVSGGATVCQYERAISLLPNTAYVLSAYLWNMGDTDNNVITVIDLNDAPDEPQVTLIASDENADQGYFVYSRFNTSATGTNVTLRIFYESLVGKGAAAKYYPVGAQWDNLAITKATEFKPPQPTGSDANLRPIIRITRPVDAADIISSNASLSLPITATASDYDGSIAKVEFFSGINKLGQMTTSPYSLVWTNAAPGPYQLTAVATDDRGATTVSAPVMISVTAPLTDKRK